MMRRRSGGALIALTLVIGFEAGILAERHLFSHGSEGAISGRLPRSVSQAGIGRGPTRFAARVSTRLSLSEEQERTIEALLNEHNAQVAILLGSVRPEITARVNQVMEDIRALLNSGQRAAFATILQEDQNRFRQRMESGLGGRGPLNDKGEGRIDPMD